MAKGRGHSWGKQGWAFGTLSPAFLEALDRREGPAKSNEQIGDARIWRGCNCTATWESETHSSELNKSPEAQTRFFNKKPMEVACLPKARWKLKLIMWVCWQLFNDFRKQHIFGGRNGSWESGSYIAQARNRAKMKQNQRSGLRNAWFLNRRTCYLLDKKHDFSNGQGGFLHFTQTEVYKNGGFLKGKEHFHGQQVADMVISQAKAWPGNDPNRKKGFFFCWKHVF